MALLIATVSEAVSAGRRRRFDEGEFHGTADYLFESAPRQTLGPQALIARQDPGWVLPVHFHMQHQFQVILRGSGTLGRHELRPGSVHYTSPESAYGPIVAGEDGLDYFTLRVLTDKGAWYLPQSRPYMTLGIFKEQAWGAMSAPHEEGEVMIPPRADGLGAWAYRHAAQREAVLPAAAAGGCFHVVIQGGYLLDGCELPVGSCVYGSPGESLQLTAMAPNSCLVVVQFPRQALDHHVPPERRMAPSDQGRAVEPSAQGY